MHLKLQPQTRIAPVMYPLPLPTSSMEMEVEEGGVEEGGVGADGAAERRRAVAKRMIRGLEF